MVISSKSFKVAYGDIEMEAIATLMGGGTINIMVKKNLSEAGALCLAVVVDYEKVRWTVCFQHDYFPFKPGQFSSKQYIGDCLMMDDKDAILERLKEIGFI